jgi:hypothetical protein
MKKCWLLAMVAFGFIVGVLAWSSGSFQAKPSQIVAPGVRGCGGHPLCLDERDIKASRQVVRWLT